MSQALLFYLQNNPNTAQTYNRLQPYVHYNWLQNTAMTCEHVMKQPNNESNAQIDIVIWK